MTDMNFEDLINNGWSKHAEDAQGVAGQLAESQGLIENNEQIPSYVSLLTHVYGGHLGNWQQGIELLKVLLEHPKAEGHDSIYRSLAILSFCADDQAGYTEYLAKAQEKSHAKARVLAQVASELVGQKQVERGMKAFEAGGDNLTIEDPTARSLAISGNNLVCGLEEKAARSDDETKLMELAANSARQYWEIAGCWTEVERAEYRLSMTYLQSGKIDRAIDYAKTCLSICEENEAAPFEFFFAHEGLAKIYKSEGRELEFHGSIKSCVKYRDQVKESWQQYCVIPK